MCTGEGPGHYHYNMNWSNFSPRKPNVNQPLQYQILTKKRKEKEDTWEMHPPRPMPSKNWWKDNAATRGLIVFGLSEAPKEIPIITEWTTIPNSKTYLKKKNYNLIRTCMEWKDTEEHNTPFSIRTEQFFIFFSALLHWIGKTKNKNTEVLSQQGFSK